MKRWTNFCGHISFKVVDGSKISFWARKWWGESELREVFSLFISCNLLKREDSRTN